MALLDGSEPARPARFDTSAASPERCAAIVERVARHILASATFDRDDRLFPSDPRLFEMNPLNVAYGACGVAYALQKIASLPGWVIDWIERREVTASGYAPGLYSGLSGIAWTLLELGYDDLATKVIVMTHDHPLTFELADVFDGASGYGMTQLKFFLATGRELFLSKAIQAGEYLIAARQEAEVGWCWPASGVIYAGFAHGAAGVALFLLHLYLATRDERFLDAGRKAIDFVLSKKVENGDNGWTWKFFEGHPTSTPYWQHGSAGVGTALLRYYAVLSEPRYLRALRAIANDCNRKYAIFPERLFGLAGVGDFLLDMADFGVDTEQSLEKARKVTSGILLFAIARPDGVAFPGEELMRLSCDYGTGSAGIALFLKRFATGGTAPFMLDEMILPARHPCPPTNPMERADELVAA